MAEYLRIIYHSKGAAEERLSKCFGLLRCVRRINQQFVHHFFFEVTIGQSSIADLLHGMLLNATASGGGQADSDDGA